MKRFTFLVFGAIALLLPAYAQEEKNVTEVYKVPVNFLSAANLSGDPFARHPSDTENVAPTVSPKAVLENVGISFPEKGGLATFDSAKRELTVTTTPSQQALVQAYTASLMEDVEKEIEMRFELYSVPQLISLDLMDSLRDSVDATGLIEKVREMVKKKEITMVASPTVLSRSGQRSKISNGKEYRYISGYRVKDEKEEPTMGHAESGTVFEVDPVLGSDSMTIDIILSLHHSNQEMEIRPQTMVGPISGKDLPFETVVLNQADVITAVTVLDGQFALVGAVNSTDDPSQVLMLFLKADVHRVF